MTTPAPRPAFLFLRNAGFLSHSYLCGKVAPCFPRPGATGTSRSLWHCSLLALAHHLTTDHHPVSTGTTPCYDDDDPSPHFTPRTTHSPPRASLTRRSLWVTLVCPREVSENLLFSVGVNHSLTTFSHSPSFCASTLSGRGTSPADYPPGVAVGTKLGFAVLCRWAVMHPWRKSCTDRPC